jgi:hypothetical protein
MKLGRPAIGIVVTLYPPLSSMRETTIVTDRVPTATAVTDDDGFYAFRDAVAPGRYELELQSLVPPLLAGSQPGYLARMDLILEASEPVRRVDLGLR